MLVFGAELLNPPTVGGRLLCGDWGGIPVGMFTAAQTNHKRVFLIVLKGFGNRGAEQKGSMWVFNI